MIEKRKISIQPLSLILITTLLVMAYPAHSTRTGIWKTSTFEEFQQGELTDLSLTFTGALSLAPRLEELLALQEQDLFVWALVEDSQGNLYAGTGEQGRIYKITPDGEVSLFFDSPEIGIISLAVDSEDNIYAGSAPDGFIYKISPTGTQTTFFSTEQPYVWTLVFDENNILYAGTGEAGKIFRIMPDGSGSVLYDSPQAHVMSLLYDAQGWLYAGTEGKAVVYKIGLDGVPFSLYHAEEEEIHSLTLDSQGNLYLAAISSTLYPKPQIPASSEQQAPPKEKTLKVSNIYQINPSGSVVRILEVPDTLIYAMLVDEHDQLIVGTDEKGLLYRVFPDGNYQQITRVEAGNILSLLRHSNGNLCIGTGDTGMVFQLAPETVEQGSYLSAVYDIKTAAKWGKISWRGTVPQITLATRTGNTATPDDTWSAWTEELKNSEGENILNPPARFIQWRASLTATPEQANPSLEEVSLAYLPNNLAPMISRIVIYYTGAGEENGKTSQVPKSVLTSSPIADRTPTAQGESRKRKELPKPPKQLPPGRLAVIWEAEDPNNDTLLYTLALRGENDPEWKVLEEELEVPVYLLDTFALPDGDYYLKITADDSPDNPPGRVLRTEMMTERFEIDNTAPEISMALNQRQGNETVLVTVVAHDEFSRLQHAEYSVDTGEWLPIFPDDDIHDSKDEKYSIKLPELTPGDHIIIFRVTDQFDNIGVGKMQFSTAASPSQ